MASESDGLDYFEDIKFRFFFYRMRFVMVLGEKILKHHVQLQSKAARAIEAQRWIQAFTQQIERDRRPTVEVVCYQPRVRKRRISTL